MQVKEMEVEEMQVEEMQVEEMQVEVQVEVQVVKVTKNYCGPLYSLGCTMAHI